MRGKSKIGITTLLLAAAMTWSLASQAQGPGPGGGGNPGRFVDRMAQELNLTEEQKSRVQSYLEDQQSQMQVLRNDTTLTRDQRAQRMREITQQTRDKIDRKSVV